MESIKDKLREFKQIKAPYSDIQGISYAMAYNLNKNKIEEIDNILLLFFNNELNINESKRFILDLI